MGKKDRNKFVESDDVVKVVEKPGVLKQTESEANVEAKQTFRFTPTQVQFITCMMDRHGEDYSAMARDPKNHYQETANKIKGMIKKFINIPEQYAVYCKEKGLITSAESKEELADVENSEQESMDEEENYE